MDGLQHGAWLLWMVCSTVPGYCGWFAARCLVIVDGLQHGAWLLWMVCSTVPGYCGWFAALCLVIVPLAFRVQRLTLVSFAEN